MFAFDAGPLGGLALVGVSQAAAAEGGRMDLLAAEAARVARAVPPEVADPSSWPVLATLLLSTTLAAFVGTWVGIRSFTFGRIRDKDGVREVTYRFRSGSPLRLGQDTVKRLSGLLNDLEDLGGRLRTARTAAPEVPADESATSGDRAEARPPSPAREIPRAARAAERRAAWEQARTLLREGRDPREVRELTGLKTAELDLLRAAPGPADGEPAIRRGRPRIHFPLRTRASVGDER